MENVLENSLFVQDSKKFQKLSCSVSQFNSLYNGNNIIQDDIFFVLTNYVRRNQKGLELLRFPTKDDDFCALTCVKKGQIFVYVNSWLPLFNQIFAAAHELYHIWCFIEEKDGSVLKKGSILNAAVMDEDNFYAQYYASLEQYTERSEEDFFVEIARCDTAIGCDNNLGEIKTYLLQQVLQNREDIQLYIFCSDDKKARIGMANVGGIFCISAISSFYVLKEKLRMERSEAKLYFDSWMQFHQSKGQTSFKVHSDTKEMQVIKMDGYEIFDRIYNGTMTILKNGNLKIRNCDF